MANTYFTPTLLARFTTADAERLNTILKSIEAGFDKLPTAQELQQGSRNYSVASNNGNAYAVTVPFSLASYTAGLQLTFLAVAANTSTATLNVNNLGPVTIKRFDNTNLLVSDIRAVSLNTVVYDGAAFRLVSMHGGTEALATTSATNAAASATAAATSASQALASRNAAAVSESNALASANTSAAALTGTRFGLRNALLNPLFWVTNPLGLVFSGTYASGRLIRDRWRAGPQGVTFSISNSTATITAGSIYQVIQGRNLMQPGAYTLSWVGTAPASVNNVSVPNGGSVTLASAQNATVSFGVGTVSQPQLEYGSIKTPFEIRSTDYEIMACAQYYQKSWEMNTAPGSPVPGTSYHVSIAYSPVNLTQGYIEFPYPMRGTPAMSVYSTDGTPGVVFVTTPSVNVPINIGIPSHRGFQVTCNTAQLTVGSFVIFHWVADAEL